MKARENISLDAPPSGPSLTRRAAWLVWSGVVNLANSVLLWMVMARWRDAAEVGRFTIAVSIYLAFVALGSLGLGPYLVSEITRRKAQGGTHHSFIASAAAFLLLCSVLFAVLMCATGLWVSAAAEVESTTALMSLALLPSGLIVVAEAVFIANGKTRVIALANTIENIFRTLVPLGLVMAGFSLWLIGLSFVGARLLACLVYVTAASGHLSSLWLAQRKEVLRLAQATPTFAGITMLSSLHWQLAVLLLAWLGNEVAAAHYGVASRFLVPVAVLLASYTSVLQPEATSRAAASRAALGAFLSKALRWVLVLALPFAVGTWLLAREALTWLFGAPYGAAAVTLALLGASVVPLSVVMIVARGLVATGRQQIDLLGNLVGVITCGIAGILLIPWYGANGAAAAHLLSMMALALVEVVYVARQLFRVEIASAVLSCLVPLMSMSIVVWYARVWGLWSAMLLGALVYFVILGALQHRLRTSTSTRVG
jgi:O-antigen/teichoic acid export membrane protein